MRTDPVVRRLKELLRGDFIGDVLHIHGTMSQAMLGELSEETDQWRLDPDLSGGCALMNIGIYPLNTTRFILEADPTEVYGHTRSEHDPFEAVDEHATFQLRFPDGVRALCSVSQNAQHASRLEITGTDGQLLLDPAFYEREDRELTLVRDGVESEIEFDPVHQLEEEFAYFGHHLLTDTNFVSIRDRHCQKSRFDDICGDTSPISCTPILTSIRHVPLSGKTESAYLAPNPTRARQRCT